MKINHSNPSNQPFLEKLSNIHNSPEKIYHIGEMPSETHHSLAIVGSRKPTAYGREVAYRVAHDLAKLGIYIISGLALGIDAIAHKACLEAGGKTVAVLANGLDQICPRSNHHLAQEIIVQKGLIISQYPPNSLVQKAYFVERNRLISGLSEAVLVIEATSRSGSLTTARFALEQGREVMAIPGSISSPLSAGCNSLIKQGAHPITSAQDVLEIIAPELIVKGDLAPLGNNKTETEIIRLIKSGLRDGDEIRQKLNLPIDSFNVVLTTLEIDGRIKALGGNKWAL